MVIETRDESSQVRGEIIEGHMAGSLSLPRHDYEDRAETHAEVARQLADRPAVRVISQTECGYLFEA